VGGRPVCEGKGQVGRREAGMTATTEKGKRKKGVEWEKARQHPIPCWS